MLYADPNPSEALRILQKYQVSYVIVGQMERLYYPAAGLTKFEDGLNGNLELVYENPETKIYRVTLEDTSASLVPAGAEATTEAAADDSPPTAAPAPGAAERDAERRSELLQLAEALADYKANNGSYPSTNNNLQTACVFEELDVLCRFKSRLGPGAFMDPFGDSSKYGYWYASDGKSFTLYAILEQAPGPEETCTPSGDFGSRRNLYCLQVEQQPGRRSPESGPAGAGLLQRQLRQSLAARSSLPLKYRTKGVGYTLRPAGRRSWMTIWTATWSWSTRTPRPRSTAC